MFFRKNFSRIFFEHNPYMYIKNVFACRSKIENLNFRALLLDRSNITRWESSVRRVEWWSVGEPLFSSCSAKEKHRVPLAETPVSLETGLAPVTSRRANYDATHSLSFRLLLLLLILLYTYSTPNTLDIGTYVSAAAYYSLLPSLPQPPTLSRGIPLEGEATDPSPRRPFSIADDIQCISKLYEKLHD